MLTSEEQSRLQAFVDRTSEGTPFRRRARLLLLTADGVPPERSANLVGITIPQARHFLNAFKKQGTSLFADAIWQVPPSLEADTPLAQGIRQLLAPQIQALVAAANDPDWGVDADAADLLLPALRQLAYADSLCTGILPAGCIIPRQAGRRKLYRRLRRAVRTEALAELAATSRPDGVETAAAVGIHAYWQAAAANRRQQAAVYLNRRRSRRDAVRLQAWSNQEIPVEPTALSLKLAAPVTIMQQLAAVRAAATTLGTDLNGGSRALVRPVERLHDSLALLAPLFGPEWPTLQAPLAALAAALADFDQLRWSQKWLMRTPAAAADLAAYQSALTAGLTTQAEIVRDAWTELDRPAWRQQLTGLIGGL